MDGAKYYNAAYLVDPAGATSAIYRKQHLVPFGEYVPLRNVLSFVSPLIESVGAFTPGVDPDAAAGRRATDQYGDLLRGDLSRTGP